LSAVCGCLFNLLAATLRSHLHPLKFIYSSIQVSDVLVLTVCKLINFVFQLFPLFIPEMMLTSRPTLKMMSVLKVFIFSCAYYGLFGNSNGF
jgi:hypothetical protein